MTAFNPPSILFFNGVTFNPEIIEGDTVSGGGGDVTLAGNNTFTGINSFTNAAGIKVNDIDTIASSTILSIGKTNAAQILLGNSTNPIPVTIAESINVFVDELVVNVDSGKKYVAVDECYFTTGTGNQATIDTKTAVPIHIAPSTTVEPFAICSGVVIGNTTIPVTVSGNAISLSGPTTLSGANIFSSSNNFTTGLIDVTTQTAGNSTTLAASTAFVTGAISALSSIYQTAAQVTTAIDSELTTFRGTANTFTANQIFPTIQFSTGTLNQQFRIQHSDNISFGAVNANSSVTTVFSYTTLGLTNFTTYITAQISNSSAAGNGSRVLFSIQSASATSFTIVGFNVTAINTAASAFTIVVYGR